MTLRTGFGSRAFAIFASGCALLASACSAAPDDGSDEIPGEPAPSGEEDASADAGARDAATDGARTDAIADAAPHDAAAHDAHDAAPPSNGCPALAYPSGIEIQTVPNAAMTASYANHLAAGQTAPKCFLDVADLVDPRDGTKYDLSVHVATNFQLEELVGTEVSQGYGNFVLMAPSAVASLQKFRELVGGPVSVNSGFRSPKHQEDVCRSLCGDPLGCPGTCANNSRHMWGDAFDLPLEFYTAQDEQRACDAGFKFAYLESGTHLHIDQNPAYQTCVKE